MDEKRNPMMAGLGGAALATALVAMGGSVSTPSTDTQAHKTAVVQRAGDHPDITSNQDGPWYAFCQEYSTTEFDRGDDGAKERGISGHRVPREAEEGTVEITRKIRGVTGEPEEEKFNVKKHTVGDLKSCVPGGGKLRIVIATVPDPNATQMRLDFDRDVVAIQRAAATGNYHYTRFWFPWRGDSWTPDKSDDPEAEIRRRQEPGILCFRANGKPGQGDPGTGERLFVLLVGETPTSGVNRIQFAHALYYAAQLNAATIRTDGASGNNSSQQERMVVAGPHFSASFSPIQDVLTEVEAERTSALLSSSVPAVNKSTRIPAAQPPRPVTFISPDASSKHFIEEFRRFCEARGLCELQTLALPSDQAQETTLRFLRDTLRYDPRFVAQWSEDESAFGESEFEEPSATSPENHRAMPAAASPLDYGLKLRFPRDLSSVRSLSDEQSAKVAEAASKYLTLPGGSLPTRLAAREPIDRDAPAAYGTEQEAAEVARGLAESLAEMRAHRIRAVVIAASNPLDRIYLLEYLHNQMPDVRTVTIDADGLELDRPHFVDLTGTLAITATPPLSGMFYKEDQREGTVGGEKSSSAADHQVSFASSRQAGEFLAIRTALTTVPRESSQASQSGAPAACSSVSIIGEDGLQLLPDGNNTNASPRFPCSTPASGSDGDPSRQTPPTAYLAVHRHLDAPPMLLTFAGLALLWNLLHFWSVRGAARGVEREFSYSRSLVGTREPDRLYLLYAVNNQLVILDVMLGRLAWQMMRSLSGEHHHGSLWRALSWTLALKVPGLAALALVTAAAIVMSIAFSLQFVRSLKCPQIDKQSLTKRRFEFGIATIYLVTSLWMVFRLPFNSSGDGVFLERFMQLGNGLSPLLPVTCILLGYFLWGRAQLRRLEWSASRKAHLEFSETLNRVMYENVDALQRSMEELIPDQVRLQVPCFLLALLVAIVLRDSLNGLEGPVFYAWFTVWGVLMLLLTVTMTFAQAWSIWHRLLKLLIWLETTPLREAFQKLCADEILQVKIWDMAKTEKSFTILRSTFQSIVRLDGPGSPEAVRAGTQLNLLLRADTRHRQLLPGQIDRLSRALNVLMDPAIESLSSDSFLKTRRDELQVYLSLRLVALIRYAMLHMGAMIRFVAYGFVLAVGSIMFYPFEGRKTIGELLAITFAGLLIWIGVMMVQFQRNGMLSRLDGSKPGEANFGKVVLHLLTVGGLPLLAILTSQFPSIANVAYTFFRPLLGILH